MNPKNCHTLLIEALSFIAGVSIVVGYFVYITIQNPPIAPGPTLHPPADYSN